MHFWQTVEAENARYRRLVWTTNYATDTRPSGGQTTDEFYPRNKDDLKGYLIVKAGLKEAAMPTPTHAFYDLVIARDEEVRQAGLQAAQRCASRPEMTAEPSTKHRR